MTDLNGRRALVTGGTRGIGAAVARKLSEAGARVVVSARSRGDYDGAAHFIAADISAPDGPPRLAAQALDYLGGIDILVDNAASQTVVPGGVLAMTEADWLADLNSSLLSAVRVDRVVLPGMIAAGGGAIVHIGSNAARLPRPAALAYAAAKAALATYSKALATEVGPRNVRVNLVSPGVIETSAFAARIQVLADKAGTDLATAREQFMAGFDIPLRRPGTIIHSHRLGNCSPGCIFTPISHRCLSATPGSRLRLQTGGCRWPRTRAHPSGVRRRGSTAVLSRHRRLPAPPVGVAVSRRVRQSGRRRTGPRGWSGS